MKIVGSWFFHVILFVGGFSQVFGGTYLVTNFGDSVGTAGCLRKAIFDANLNPGRDTIQFNVGDTITLTNGALYITDETFIDGYGYAITLRTDQPSNDTIFAIDAPNTKIQGLNLLRAQFGICVRAQNCTVYDNRFLGCIAGINISESGTSVFNNQFGITTADVVFSNQIGIEISSGNNNTIKNNSLSASRDYDIYASASSRANIFIGNRFGFNAKGAATIDTVFGPNYAMLIYGSAQIGDGTYAGRNIFGCYSSTIIGGSSDSISILGNFFGLYPDGQTSVRTLYGAIIINYSNDVNIGNGTAAGRNIFATGFLYLNNSNRNKVLGNYFGTDSTGLSRGDLGIGVFLQGGSQNVIGDGTTGGRNIFATTSTGLFADPASQNNFVVGNYFGLGADGSANLGGTYGIENSSSNLSIGNGTVSGRNYFASQQYGIRNIGRGMIVNNNVFGLAADGTTARSNDYAMSCQTGGNGGIIRNNVLAGGPGTLFGIYVNSDSNTVELNLIGTDVTGTVSRGFSVGIQIQGGKRNRIGNGLADGRNTIAGNLYNVDIENSVDSTWVDGNFIGLSKTGASHGGTWGVYVASSRKTIVTNNVIGSCSNSGLFINQSSDILIQNNKIGTDTLGSGLRGNTESGIRLANNNSRVLIANNIIANNQSYGIELTDAVSDSNRWAQNLIYNNFGGSIVKFSSNAQQGIAPPRIYGGLLSTGMMWGKSAPNVKIEVFRDSVGKSQASVYVGATTAGANGDWSLNAGTVFSGTYTAIQDSAENSSTFSNRIDLAAIPDLLVQSHTNNSSFPLGDVNVGDSVLLPIRFYSSNGSLIVNLGLLHGAPFQYMGPTMDTLDILHPDTLLGYIKFKPTAIGNFTDTLLVTFDTRRLEIYVTGAGILRILSANVQVYNFNSVKLDDSATVSITVKAPQSPVTLSDLSLSSGSHFVITSSTALPRTITSDSETITIKFKPISAGALSDTLRIVYNGNASPMRIPLLGDGIPRFLSANIQVHNFVSLKLGDSAAVSITVKAPQSSVTLSELSLSSGSHFVITGSTALPRTIASDSVTITIKFKPLSTGALSDTLRIGHNGNVSPMRIPLLGAVFPRNSHR